MGIVAWTVLIVDDHAGFRAGARALLEADGFDVLGEAADGESAVEQVRRLRPQVVLLDVQLPGMDGFAVAERLAAEPSAPAVVLISSRGQGAYRRRLQATPARGFITKAEFSGECLSSLLA
jgi:DNA-binding NarL/FixJ family response regulator